MLSRPCDTVELAKVHGSDRARLVILSDLPSRRVARLQGPPIVGTVGLFLAAKEAGAIDVIAPILDQCAKTSIPPYQAPLHDEEAPPLVLLEAVEGGDVGVVE
jgi:hypothetical protein